MATMLDVQHFLSNLLPSSGWDFPIIFVSVVTSITAILLSTRLITGNNSVKLASGDQGSSPPTLPYWIPLLGHVPQFLYDVKSLLKEAKESFPGGIFALKLGNQTRNVIYAPVLIKNMLAQGETTTSKEPMRLTVMKNVFGLPSKRASLYSKLHPLLDQALIPHVSLKDLPRDKLVEIMRHMQGNLSDLVTLNSSMVDQEPWERMSAAQVSPNGDAAEVSLLPLIYIFLTHMTTDTLFTPSVLSDTDHYEIVPLLMTLIQSYKLLLTGLPRTIPHPHLPSAHITRKKLLNHLATLSTDVLEDPDMQGSLLAARQEILDKHEVPLDARASNLLELLWNINTPHVLAFWMILHIISDPGLSDQVRAEISKHVKAIQEPLILGFTVPPRITIDTEGLMLKCPLLKACYIETVRLYARGWHASKVSQDFQVQGSEQKLFKSGEKWNLAKGEWVDIPYWLCNTDPANYVDAEKWDPERHLHSNEKGEQSAEWGSVFSDYGILGIDEAKDLLQAICFAFVAGTLIVWDIEPVAKKGSTIPKAEFGAGVALPGADVRACIKRRTLPSS